MGIGSWGVLMNLVGGRLDKYLQLKRFYSSLADFSRSPEMIIYCRETPLMILIKSVEQVVSLGVQDSVDPGSLFESWS